MEAFNLNNYVFVQITEYGWEYLAATYDSRYIQYSIKNYKETIDGVEYYKLQAHHVITTFGGAIWATHPAPIKSTILIP